MSHHGLQKVTVIIIIINYWIKILRFNHKSTIYYMYIAVGGCCGIVFQRCTVTSVWFNLKYNIAALVVFYSWVLKLWLFMNVYFKTNDKHISKRFHQNCQKKKKNNEVNLNYFVHFSFVLFWRITWRCSELLECKTTLT